MNATKYTECPSCLKCWRDVEIEFQACESCLFISHPQDETLSSEPSNGPDWNAIYTDYGSV